MKHILLPLLRVLLIVSLILALGIAPALASSIPARINNSNAEAYIAPGKSGTLRAGTSVNVVATKNGWAQIEYNGQTAYTRVENLTAAQGITAYVKKSVPAYKSASTSSKKSGPLLVGTELQIVGVSGNFYQVTNGKIYAYVQKDALSNTKPSDSSILASKVQLLAWAAATVLFPKGNYVEIYDIKSGMTIRAYRMGGTNHAELEPATSEDTQKMFQMGGGKYSWDSRPVIVKAGDKYIPAAINTMPHGDETILDNNFEGQFCLHLLGSKTHGSDTVNTNHLAAVQYAYKWAQENA